MRKIISVLRQLGFWLVWPGLWLLISGSRRTRVVIRYQDQLLVVRGWLGDQTWSLPGGGLHKSEDPASGAVREVLEETSLKLKPEQLRLLGHEPISSKGIKFDCYFFVCDLSQRLSVRKQFSEIAEVRWLKLSDIKQAEVDPPLWRSLQLLLQ